MRFFLIFMMFCFGCELFGQSETSSEYLKHARKGRFNEGYIEMRNGEIIEGVLSHPKGFDNIITLVTKEGTKLKVYGKELSSYLIDETRFVNTGENVFFEELIRGKVSLYKGQSTGSFTTLGATGFTTSPTSNVSYYVRKSGEAFVHVKRTSGIGGAWGFAEKFNDYFADCPPVAEKIMQKSWKARDIEIIVNAYNSMCQ